jgi:hypothetical protein
MMPGRVAVGAVNLVACALLLIQYLLGMVVNVYVVLPGRHPGAGAGDYFSGATAGLAWVVAGGVQRGQLRQLRACLQLADHGGAMGTGGCLLPDRSDTRIPFTEHRSSEASISAVLLE